MTSYCVEYAKSNRSSCKGTCKAKIDKGAIRIGTTKPGPGDYDMTSWRHLECQKKPKDLASVDDMSGLLALSEADQQKVEAWLNGGTPKKRSAEELDADAALDPKKMKVGALKKTLEQRGVADVGALDKAGMQGMVDEVKQRAEAEAVYAKMNIPQLKAVLGANGQLKGGTKGELVERCVDGKLFGALPKCSLCGGGTLRVVYNQKIGHGGVGRYSCPGYFDDDHYVRCSFKAETAERIPWQDA